MARVGTMGRAAVAWTDFEQPHRSREWRYEALRFVFDLGQYKSALAKIA